MDPHRRSLVGLALLGVAGAAALSVSREAVVGVVDAVAGDPLVCVAAVFALYLVRPAVLWPPTLVAVVAGYGLGVAVGLPVAFAGAVLTSAPPFYAARWVGARDEGLIGRLASIGGGYFDAAGDLRGVVAARLAPIPADAVSCAAGLSGVPFRVFAAGVLVGEIPWTVAAVLAGSSLSAITAEGLDGVGPAVVAAATLAAALLLAGPLYERVRGGPDADAETRAETETKTDSEAGAA